MSGDGFRTGSPEAAMGDDGFRTGSPPTINGGYRVGEPCADGAPNIAPTDLNVLNEKICARVSGLSRLTTGQVIAISETSEVQEPCDPTDTVVALPPKQPNWLRPDRQYFFRVAA